MKRARKLPSHLKDFDQYKQWNDGKMYKVVLDSNHKEYSVALKELETVDGMPANEKELSIGTKVIWLHKGKKPYKGEIAEIPDSYTMTKKHKSEICGTNTITNSISYDVDLHPSDDTSLSDDGDDSDHVVGKIPCTSQLQSQTKKNQRGIEDQEIPSIQQECTIYTTNHMELLITIDKKLNTLLERSESAQSDTIKTTIQQAASSSIIIDDEDMSLSLISKKDPVVYALNLMDTLFTDQEMQGHLLVKKKRSRSTREALDHDKVKKLFGILASEFGKERVKRDVEKIVEKCNQKCRDKEKKLVKKEENFEEYLEDD